MSRTTDMVDAAELIYARALLELAQESNQLDSIAEEVAGLGELLAGSADLQRLLDNQILPLEQRAASVDRLFRGKVSDTLYRFLQVVNRKSRLPQLDGIIRAFGKLYAQSRGVVEVDAMVAQRMDDDKMNDIATRIGQAINRKVVPHQHVDESLIGGLKLRVGDQLIDGSVVTQLKLMQQKMIAAGREAARAAAN